MFIQSGSPINLFPTEHSSSTRVSKVRDEAIVADQPERTNGPRTKKSQKRFRSDIEKALSNHAANRTTSRQPAQQPAPESPTPTDDATSDTRMPIGDTGPEPETQSQESLKEENEAASVSSQLLTEGVIEGEDRQEVVTEILKRILNLLNLPTQALESMVPPTDGTASETTVESFAEVLFSIDKIAEILKSAVEKNVPLTFSNMTITPPQALELEHELRIEANNLTIALKFLGISGDVVRSLLEKKGLPTDGKLPMAIDPATLPGNGAILSIENSTTGDDELRQVLQRIVQFAMKESNETPLQRPIKETVGTLAQLTQAETPNAVEPLAAASQSENESAALSTMNGNKEKTKDKNEESDVGFKILAAIDPAAKDEAKKSLKELFTPARFPTVSGMESSEVVSDQKARASIEAGEPVLPRFQKTAEFQIFSQISTKLIHAAKNHHSQISLTLKPEYLGNVRMTIQIEEDVIHARINVENSQVKQIIENNFSSLKDALEQQNLKTGQFDVSVDRESTGDDANRFGASGSPQNGGSTDSAQTDETDSTRETIGRETGRRMGYNTVEFLG